MDNGTNKFSTSPATPNGGQPPQRRLRPFIATAAGAVIVASLVATATMTGLLQKASSNGAQNPQTQSAAVTQQPVVDSAAPNPAQQPPVQQPSYAQQPPQHQVVCTTCGTVEAISAVRHKGHGTGIGAVGGAVAAVSSAISSDAAAAAPR